MRDAGGRLFVTAVEEESDGEMSDGMPMSVRCGGRNVRPNMYNEGERNRADMSLLIILESVMLG